MAEMNEVLYNLSTVRGITNYGEATPGIWRFQTDDVPVQQFREVYEKDMVRLAESNIKIPSRDQLPTGVTRLATYNLHFLSNTNGTEPNVANITDVIDKINADVWCFQEMLLPESGGLTGSVRCKTKEGQWMNPAPYERLGKTHAFAGLNTMPTAYTDGKTGWGVGVAADNLMKFAAVKPLLLEGPVTVGDDDNHNRGCMIIRTEIDGVDVIICSVHLDVVDKTGGTRRRQIESILAELKQYADIPVFVLGDFNCMRWSDYTSTEHKWLDKNSRGGIDFNTTRAFEDHRPIDNDWSGTVPGFVDLFAQFPTQRLCYSVWTGRRVDYMYVRCPNTYKVNVHGLYVYYSSASDHLPLIADISIAKTTYEHTYEFGL